jgi:ESCRT-I complex subunit TSG101
MSATQSEKAIGDLLAKCQYKYKDLTRRDLVAALSYFKELFVKIDKHVYSNGLAKDLVTLTGTVPVNFKNNRYNIPVQLFLSDSHPYEPPLVYVRPTAEMNINVSETVDSNGRVYLPCLSDWKYPTSELYMLLNFMTIKFSEKTPLYSKPAGGASPAASRPVSAIQSHSTSSISNNAATPYPTQPPYPMDAFRPTYPMPGANSAAATPTYPQPPYPLVDSTGLPSYSAALPSTYGQPNPYYPKTVQPPPPIPPAPQPLSHIKSSSSKYDSYFLLSSFIKKHELHV